MQYQFFTLKLLHCFFVRRHKHGFDYGKLQELSHRGICYSHDYNVCYPACKIYKNNENMYCARCNKE